jgi:transposase
MPPAVKRGSGSRHRPFSWKSSDKTIAPTLLEGLKPERDLIADRGYDARAIIDLVESRGGRAHIPTCRDRKVQRSVDHALYRQRNLIERFFDKPKHFGRIATRYDKTARKRPRRC